MSDMRNGGDSGASRPGASSHAWTAAEVFSAVAPDRVCRLKDSNAELARETARAHFAAARAGWAWNPEGRYPLDVWIRLSDRR